MRAIELRPSVAASGAVGERTHLARPFAAGLRGEFVAVIAEVKRSSPSKGAINPELDAAEQAARFEVGGAKAISVLTEPLRFGGRLADIGAVRAASVLPVLKKDFHTSAAHFREAHSLGASAALLIVRAVPPSVVRECIALARAIGLDLLVEVHTRSELDLAIDAGAGIIGVNARNLETLKMNARVHAELLPAIPPGIIAVAESGMSTREDVARAAAAGADAVLIGSSLSRAADVPGLLRELATVPRRNEVRAD